MIKSFSDKEAERIFERRFSRKLPPEIQAIARRKLEMLDAAEDLADLLIPPANRLENFPAIGGTNTAFASITNGVSASNGRTATLMAWKSWITTKRPNHV